MGGFAPSRRAAPTVPLAARVRLARADTHRRRPGRALLFAAAGRGVGRARSFLRRRRPGRRSRALFSSPPPDGASVARALLFAAGHALRRGLSSLFSLYSFARPSTTTTAATTVRLNERTNDVEVIGGVRFYQDRGATGACTVDGMNNFYGVCFPEVRLYVI